MYKKKLLSQMILILMVLTLLIPAPVIHAASPVDNVLTTLASSTVAGQDSATHGTGILEKLFGFLFEKVLGPVLNIFNSKSTSNLSTSSSTTGISLPSTNNSTPIVGSGTLKGKTIVVDPGHGGSNPGAVANNTRESDNNLAVSLKLRDKLVQAGANVIMTRDTDRTVAPEGSSLGAELEARIKLAETNHADIFVSIHSNENPTASIAGAMTFYPTGKSSALAVAVEKGLIAETNANDKGTSPATFYVLRNNSVPSTLVEMGFVSNPEESALLHSDAYRTKIAQGIFNGIVQYFN